MGGDGTLETRCASYEEARTRRDAHCGNMNRTLLHLRSRSLMLLWGSIAAFVGVFNLYHYE